MVGYIVVGVIAVLVVGYFLYQRKMAKKATPGVPPVTPPVITSDRPKGDDVEPPLGAGGYRK